MHNTTDVLVTVAHLRSLRWCMAGARLWFARHGVDWRAFVQHGVPAATLEAVGDAFALAIVRHAKQQAMHGRS